MSQSIKIRTASAANQEKIQAAWEKAAKAVPQAASRDRGKVNQQLPPQVSKTRVVKVTSIPRTTIKGTLVGTMTRELPEISRPIAGRTMF